MRRLTSTRTFVAAAIIAVTSLMAVSPPAHAGGYRVRPCYSYRKVTVYTYAKIPYKRAHVAYDHCGNRVVRYSVSYRRVKVPTTKWIKVWH